MAVDKFKFISPGVFINEIDDSAIPELPERMGPVVVGRFRKGPSMRPVKVSSYSEFVSLFGSPADGNARGDIWRTGALTAPTYAGYAVQAWLRNNSPVTVFRLLGEEHDNADSSIATANAGWKTTNTLGTNLSASGGAYGLFIMPNSDDLAGGTQATIDLTSTVGAFAHSSGFTINVPTSIGGGDGQPCTISCFRNQWNDTIWCNSRRKRHIRCC